MYDSLPPTRAKILKEYLEKPHTVNDEKIRFVDWLEHNRIELNTVIYHAKPKAVWNWIKWKLQRVWPECNGNRAIFIDEALRSPKMQEFIEWYDNYAKKILESPIKEKEKELSKVKGIYDDTNTEKENIETALINEKLLKDEQVQSIDLALDSIMKNGGA
jgi:hypothetical protein